jgi:hypothetical protein
MMINVTTMALMIEVVVVMMMMVMMMMMMMMMMVMMMAIFFILLSNERGYAYLLNCVRERYLGEVQHSCKGRAQN